jgi:hypothetical protein
VRYFFVAIVVISAGLWVVCLFVGWLVGWLLFNWVWSGLVGILRARAIM